MSFESGSINSSRTAAGIGIQKESKDDIRSDTVFQKMGILGIGLLMFVENVFPPIPSELIMPLAGFSAARGERSLVIVSQYDKVAGWVSLVSNVVIGLVVLCYRYRVVTFRQRLDASRRQDHGILKVVLADF